MSNLNFFTSKHHYSANCELNLTEQSAEDEVEKKSLESNSKFHYASSFENRNKPTKIELLHSDTFEPELEIKRKSEYNSIEKIHPNDQNNVNIDRLSQIIGWEKIDSLLENTKTEQKPQIDVENCAKSVKSDRITISTISSKNSCDDLEHLDRYHRRRKMLIFVLIDCCLPQGSVIEIEIDHETSVADAIQALIQSSSEFDRKFQNDPDINYSHQWQRYSLLAVYGQNIKYLNKSFRLAQLKSPWNTEKLCLYYHRKFHQ